LGGRGGDYHDMRFVGFLHLGGLGVGGWGRAVALIVATRAKREMMFFIVAMVKRL